MKIKRTKYDDVFSKLIRERDNHTCQVCGRRDGRMDCSHFWSRRHKATRYDPMNACCKCFRCHQELGENPMLFAKWVKKYLGDTLYSELWEKHKKIRKWTKSELEEMYQHYRNELKRLESLRAEGHQGILEVIAYE